MRLTFCDRVYKSKSCSATHCVLELIGCYLYSLDDRIGRHLGCIACTCILNSQDDIICHNRYRQMCSCWSINPEARPCAEELVEYFQNIDPNTTVSQYNYIIITALI